MDPIKNIINILCREVYGVKAIYLYGSRNGDNPRPDSDYDIGILREYPLHILPGELYELRMRLEDSIFATVDLIDLSTVPLV